MQKINFKKTAKTKGSRNILSMKKLQFLPSEIRGIEC